MPIYKDRSKQPEFIVKLVEDDVRLIYNAVDFDPKLKFKKKKNIILSVARFEKRKNLIMSKKITKTRGSILFFLDTI